MKDDEPHDVRQFQVEDGRGGGGRRGTTENSEKQRKTTRDDERRRGTAGDDGGRWGTAGAPGRLRTLNVPLERF